MAKYSTPGIYTQEVNNIPTISRGESTAVFIGYTEKHENENGENLLNIPTEINALTEFETIFGKAQFEENIEIIDNTLESIENISIQFNGNQSLHNLYYSLASFFDHGGNFCKIVSVGIFKNIGEPLVAEDFLKGLKSLINQKNLLICIPEDQNLPEEDFYLLQKETLNFCHTNFGFALLNVPKCTAENSEKTTDDYRLKTINEQEKFSFGGVFFPSLIINRNYLFEENSIIIKKNNEEISLSSLKDLDEFLYQKYSNYLKKFPLIIPSIGAVAGAFIKNEKTKGIWKAPANIELINVLKPEISIDKHFQNTLNVDVIAGKSINSIIEFSGRGTIIWGSRTLNGNNIELRYISMRRLVNLIKTDIESALQQFIFEENSNVTWVRIKALIDNYLFEFYRQDALMGEKPQRAYFVKCGHDTMTAQDILESRLIIQIGIAVFRPSEFIIFEIKQKMAVD